MTARPYWVEFPGSGADKGDPYCRSHNAVSLERGLSDARHVLWRRWKENHEWVYPYADVAVITNRDTGTGGSCGGARTPWSSRRRGCWPSRWQGIS